MSNSATIVNPVECVLLTVKQAAQALQVSEKTVWNLMAAGKLQYVHILGARRIAVDELRRLSKHGTEIEADA
jgi:excisionase family DNA binding protein